MTMKFIYIAFTISFYLLLRSSAGATAQKAQGLTGRNWIAWHQGKSWRASFLRDRSAVRGSCFLAGRGGEASGSGALPTEPASRHPIINLVNTLQPTLVIPWDSAQPNLQAHPSHFWWLLYTNGLSWLMVQTVLRSLKRAASGPDVLHLLLRSPRSRISGSRLSSQLGLPPPQAQHWFAHVKLL